jgi:hypothetical protein
MKGDEIKRSKKKNLRYLRWKSDFGSHKVKKQFKICEAIIRYHQKQS